MRYFVEASFLGTKFVGWQRQPNGLSVQQAIEEALSTLLRSEIQVTGCGRTDAGVHAQKYVFHFDVEAPLPERFLGKVNRFIDDDIAFKTISEVSDDMHARFSAKSRSYKYYLSIVKEPLRQHISYRYPFPDALDFERMNEAGQLLTEFNEFKTFCKTGSDTPHYLCDLTQAEWTYSSCRATFTISANRFLRGMVRLIVGAMIQVGRHELSLEDLNAAIQLQTPLSKAESAPAHGLHLTEIQY